MYLPQALSVGVSYELFFTLNPKKLKPFVKARELNIKFESDRIHYEAWLNGLYVRLATASILSKGAKYPENPPSLSENHSDGQLSKEQAFKTRFEAWSKLHNAQIKNKKE